MNLFEKILKGLLLAGEIAGPIFVHSQHGIAILNASEEFVSALPSALASQAAQQQAGATPINKGA